MVSVSCAVGSFFQGMNQWLEVGRDRSGITCDIAIGAFFAIHMSENKS